MFCEKSEIRKKLAKYPAERTAAENAQQNGETANRSRISAISETRPKLGQIAVTGRRKWPILGIMRKRQDISRKTRNRKKIGEISRGENGCRSNKTAKRLREVGFRRSRKCGRNRPKSRQLGDDIGQFWEY